MDLKLLHEQKTNEIPRQPLGKIGQVGIISLGGQGSLEQQGGEENCTKIIRRAYELGINYFDTSPVYGPSEDYYGKALKGIRNKITLATKTDDRTRDGSLKLIEKSLKRLKTDYIDLWQLHHLDNMDEVNQITAKDGALQALLEMQEQGVVKHLGFTGHQDPKILMEMMKRHKFDSVLCPVNASDRNMNPSFIDTVVKAANRREMGIIGMKVFSQGYILNNKISPSMALNYAMSQQISTLIIGIDDIEQLEENIAIAKSFTPMTKNQMRYIESLTKADTERGSFFRKEFGGYDSKNKLEPPNKS
jgi:uncharacterized protein